MQIKKHRIVSMILVIALLIGMLSIGMVSVGAIRVFPEEPIRLDTLKSFTHVEYDDRYNLTYTPDRDITVVLEAGGGFHTFVQLYDSGNNFLGYSEDGGSGYNFRLVSRLSAGETYTFIVYCHKAPIAYDADNFWVYLSELIIPSDAAQLSMEGWNNFTLTAEDNDKWYRFTADDTNEFLFETMGFPEHWIGEYNPRYMLYTKLYDENLTKLSYQRSDSRLGSSGQYIEKSGYLLEKGKTYYLNLRMVNLADDLDEVPGKITVSYETLEENYRYFNETKNILQDRVVRAEQEFENEPFFGCYTFTPKNTGKYRVYFDNIYIDTGFGDDSYDEAILDYYNGDHRHILTSNIVKDENDAYCSPEITLNANETYSIALTVKHYAFIGGYCEFSMIPMFYLTGDADNSGEVGSTDATYIQRLLAGIPISTSEATIKRNGDVDQNGKLDIIDATFIQRYLGRFNVPFSVGERIDITAR